MVFGARRKKFEVREGGMYMVARCSTHCRVPLSTDGSAAPRRAAALSLRAIMLVSKVKQLFYTT